MLYKDRNSRQWNLLPLLETPPLEVPLTWEVSNMQCSHLRPIISFPTLRIPLVVAGFLAFIALIFCFAAGPAYAGNQPDKSNNNRWAKHPALKSFDITGKNLPPTLFLIRTNRPLPERKGVKVHGKHKDMFLVSGDARTVLDLSRSGCTVMQLDDTPAIPIPASREWIRIDTPDPDIEAMVAQVDWTEIREKIQWLVDFGTRFCLAPNHGDVAESIRDRFESYGLQTNLRPFRFIGEEMWNVEAVQPGTLYPNSCVIICGHYDSVSDDPFNLAPGADDNGTGTATVLTVAEILSQYEFEYTIRYVCFAAEEYGLVGSYFYAGEARMNNYDIVGALNFDMIGYWEPGVEKDLEIETNHASRWLADAILNAADLYTNAQYELHVYDGAWWGDHFRFWMTGYPAVNHEEAWDWYDPDFNPYYHSINDLLDHVDPGFTTDNVEVAVAAMATLASADPPQPVVCDMIPGSCPNPFNPKSRGVTSALLLGSADFDVSEVNISSLRLEDWVSPSKIRFADMSSSNHDTGHPCADMAPDGFADISIKFSTQDITSVIGRVKKGDAVSLRLRGRMFDGTVFEGEDVVMIVGKQDEALLADESFDMPPTNTDGSGQNQGLPKTFTLYQNVPNPFNPSTKIHFEVPAGGGALTLSIYDVGGRLVRTLVNGMQSPGQKTVTWDGRNEAGNPVATGTYLYRLTGPGFEQTRKMVLLK
jgi:hypothetical protein